MERRNGGGLPFRASGSRHHDKELVCTPHAHLSTDKGSAIIKTATGSNNCTIPLPLGIDGAG